MLPDKFHDMAVHGGIIKQHHGNPATQISFIKTIIHFGGNWRIITSQNNNFINYFRRKMVN